MKKKKNAPYSVDMAACTRSDTVMLWISMGVLILFLLMIIYPLLYATIASFTKGTLALNLIPERITWEGYRACLEYKLLWTGFRNSIFYMVLGTVISVVVTILCAYPLSIGKLRLHKAMLFICMFTMYFDGGLIPTFLWIKDMGLYNTIWAVILPSCLSIYNMLVMRTYFATSIPAELKEAADLDGASELTYLIRIVIPLSGAVIAVIALYYASGLWNSYFNAMLYLQDLEKLPLANVLRNLLVMAQNAGSNASGSTADAMQERQEVMRYCVIVVATVPMMCIYPFIQKYFVKGVMIGAVKG